MNMHQSRDSFLTTLPWSVGSPSLTTATCSFTSSSLTTPPGSFTSPPLTPPPPQWKLTTPVPKHILQEIRNREKERQCSTQPWQCFELDENGYKALLQWLKKDGYAEHKLRYDNNNKGLVRFANIETRIRLFPIEQTVRPSDA